MDEEDEWVESGDIAQKNQMPVEKRNDPAEVIEINARLYHVEDLYMDKIVDNLLADRDIQMNA